MIKSKSYNWLGIPYYSEVVNKIKTYQNIIVLNDLNKWTPSNCIANTNFAIALMSRLADEMLAAGKPTIIFENDHIPSSMLDYGADIVSSDLTDLERKVSNIKSDINKYNEKLNLVRNKFFTKFNNKAFISKLEKISDKENINNY